MPEHHHKHHHQPNGSTIKTHIHKHVCDYDCGHFEPESLTDRTSQRSFILAISITLVMMLFEIIGGFIVNSLALISDGGHMLTHLFALLISFFAMKVAQKPADAKNSYGYYRFEILAALANGVTLILITMWISYEAYLKILSPAPIRTKEMLLIAFLGLVTNIITAFILMKPAKQSLNVKSAFIHMLGDLLSSVAIIIGGIIIHFTGWVAIDSVLSFIICISILIWSYRLIIESVDILLEGIPKEISMEEVVDSIELIDGISGIHDLHVWTLSTNIFSLSVHVEIEKNIRIDDSAALLRKINSTLCRKFKIGHTAIQFEPVPDDEY